MRNSNSRPPIRQIFTAPEYSKWRIWLVVALLAIGATLIAFSVSKGIGIQPGWVTIEAGVQDSCSGDFALQYLLGESNKAPNLEKRELTQKYDQLARDAYQIFHESESFADVKNVCYLNTHPNEAVEVPETLYNAFALLQQHQNRSLYLAPIYAHYVGLFLCESDWAAKSYDPAQNEDAAKFISDALVFVGNEEKVKLELLGNNRVKLYVSEDYLQFAEANDITAFIDFYWLKNAFITDYIAEELIAAGYTNGILSSFDGFQRTLGAPKGSYSLNLFERVGESVYQTAVLNYTDSLAFVSLRNYPTSGLSVQQYFTWENGTITSCHIDIADGMSKTAASDLLGYSKTKGCAEILLQIYPIYVADTLNTEALATLPANGVETIYAADYVIYTSDPSANLSKLYEMGDISYRRNG